MVQDNQHFFIAQEDNGKFLRVYIPGMPQHVSGKKIIRWTREGKEHSPKKTSIVSKLFKRSLFRQGLLRDLPQRQIPGYSENYAYAVRPMAIWEITPSLKDLIYIRNDVYYLFKHTLWFPLRQLLKDNISKYNYIQLELPALPKIVTEDMLESWYEANSVARNFWNSLNKLSQKTSVQEIQNDTETVLQLTNHPFVNQPVIRLQIFPQEKSDLKEPRQKEMAILKQHVLTRDVYFLKGLTDTQRKRLIGGTSADLDEAYHLHWVKWPDFGGTYNKNNAIVVSSNIRDMYQYAVRQPFENFLKENKERLIQQGKPVFVELPIPYNTYRSKPISKVKLKRQDRHSLNQALKKSVQERTYLDD